MRTNRSASSAVIDGATHGGAIARKITDEQALRRSVMSCLLWEDEFYEDGETVAKRITALVPKVAAEKVAAIAVEARTRMHLRHVPLLLVNAMTTAGDAHRLLVASTLEQVIERADELAEFVSIYWGDKKHPLSAQAKKGLARAFHKFNAYQLAKWNQDHAVRLRDVLFLTHAKPKDEQQAADWKALAGKTLATPDTWEVSLSATKGDNKRQAWERLLSDRKLGGLALLRNLRNMQEASVPLAMIREALNTTPMDRVLPFRFISAARHAPKLEPELESAMFRAASHLPKLKGKTVLVVDESGSMGNSLSSKSELSRQDVARALAMLAREQCAEPVLYATAGNDGLRRHATTLVPPRRGFALRDAFDLERTIGGGGIFVNQVVDWIADREQDIERLIIITDEQDCDVGTKPTFRQIAKHHYVINVGSAKNGVGYGPYTHIDGWSDAVLTYIREFESPTDN
jgi:60 kDa SS-A/Ro ribonucleoprotein